MWGQVTRSLWLDRGTGPNPAQITKYSITCVYEDIRDATKASVAANAKLCGFSGVYACWNWPETAPMTGDKFADWVNTQLKRCDLDKPDAPMVDLNSENDLPGYVKALLTRWRAHRPDRVTGWTPQAHKATIYGPIAATIKAKHITVKPQCYAGADDAIRRVESASEVQSWRDLGITMVEPMLWAEDLGDWWQGTAYIAGRLP